MGDLEVLDVHVELAGQGGDLGQHAGAVGHRHAQLDELVGPGRPGRQADARPTSALEGPQQGFTIALVDDLPRLLQGQDETVEDLHDGGAVLGTDVGPDPGMAGRHPRHVAEASRRQPQQGGVLLGPLGGQAHEGGGGQVGNVGDDGHEGVVALGRHRHHVGAERRDHAPNQRVGVGLGVHRGCQDPRRPLEQGRIGPFHPLLLRARHGMAADEVGIGDGGHDRVLHPAHVGDHPAALEGASHLGGDAADGSGHEREHSSGVVSHRVEGPEGEGLLRPLGIEVPTAHVPAPRPQCEPDGSADEPGPDHGDPTRGGHLSAPWPPPGRRGAVRSGGARS